MINKYSVSEQVESHLKAQIFEGKLRSGERISIDSLAKRLGTSSTPIRDAVKRMADVGFFSVVPRKEVRVETLTNKKVREIYEIRIALESLAVRSACSLIPMEVIDASRKEIINAQKAFKKNGCEKKLIEIDNKCHELIVMHSDSPKLKDLISGLNELCIWAQRTIISHVPNACYIASVEHDGILEALSRRDANKAESLMRKHLERTLERINRSSF